MVFRALVKETERLMVAEGVFGGVDALDVVRRLTTVLIVNKVEAEVDAAVGLIKAVLSGKKANYLGAAQAALGTSFDAVKHWPIAFFDALHALGDTPYASDQDAALAATRAGVGTELAITWQYAIYTLAKLGYKRKGRATSGDTQANATLDLLLRTLENLDNVIDRFPAKFAADIRGHVEFVLRSNSGAPEELKDLQTAWISPAVLDRIEKMGLHTRFSPAPMSMGIAGAYGNSMVHFRLSTEPRTFAHELGHFVWEQVFSRERLEVFFKRVLLREVDVAESIGGFMAGVMKAIAGVREDDAAVRQVLKTWSIPYVQRAATTPDVEELKAMIARGIDTLVDQVADVHWMVVGSWNELWAETFARVLLGRETQTVKIPNAMYGLVQELLQITRRR